MRSFHAAVVYLRFAASSMRSGAGLIVSIASYIAHIRDQGVPLGLGVRSCRPVIVRWSRYGSAEARRGKMQIADACRYYTKTCCLCQPCETRPHVFMGKRTRLRFGVSRFPCYCLEPVSDPVL